MLSILIQLNPGYLLGIMGKDSLALQRWGMAEGVSRVQGPQAELIVAQARKSESLQEATGWVNIAAAWVAFLFGLGWKVFECLSPCSSITG